MASNPLAPLLPLYSLLVFLTLFPFCSFSQFLSSNSSFLSEIIDAISEKESWDPKSEVRVRVSDLDERVAKIGLLNRYEFKARVGGKIGVRMVFDDEVDWRRSVSGGGGTDTVVVDSGSDLVAGDEAVRFEPAVRDLELTGPVDLRIGVESGDLDWISLNLPSINVTHTVLRRVVIPYGIKIKVVGARQVFITHPYDIGLIMNGSLANPNEEKRPICPFAYPSCAPLLSVQVLGSILVIAHKTLNPNSPVKYSCKSNDTVELLPDKCYNNQPLRQISSCIFCSVSSKFTLLEKVLLSLLGKKSLESKYVRFLKAKIVSHTVVKFRLQLERNITKYDGVSKKVLEWRAKPRMQLVLLEVIARVKDGGKLKALRVKKVKRAFPVVESTAWSSLMSNVSFTQFPSFVLLPEALTLDVKW